MIIYDTISRLDSILDNNRFSWINFVYFVNFFLFYFANTHHFIKIIMGKKKNNSLSRYSVWQNVYFAVAFSTPEKIRIFFSLAAIRQLTQNMKFVVMKNECRLKARLTNIENKTIVIWMCVGWMLDNISIFI